MMRNSLRLMTVSVALWLSSNTGVATAGIFDEHTVNYQYYFPNLSTPYASAGNGNYLVDSGVEISDVVDGLGTIDFSGDQFTVSFSHSGSFSPTEFNGFVIRDLTANINPFTAFTLISNTGVSSTPVLSFDSNHLYVNWEGLNYSRGELVFAVESVIPNPIGSFSHTISPVPEPDTYAILLVGLGLVGYSARRKQI
ncbi:MAG: PEP-CTERM sorting domain-containing protein [Gammaproteobacteria bacterium]|nr:MAG: PEP-CTERM sorting domain-containing protein [Gammaproteobacteria bacterium]